MIICYNQIVKRTDVGEICNAHIVKRALRLVDDVGARHAAAHGDAVGDEALAKEFGSVDDERRRARARREVDVKTDVGPVDDMMLDPEWRLSKM